MFLYSLREQIKNHPFLQKKRYRIIVVVAALINGAIWYVLHSMFRYQAIQLGLDALPLHYNIYFGIDFYGNFNYLYGLPGFGLGILILNTALAIYIYKRSHLLAAYLMYAAVVIQVILAWAFFLIMKFNT